MSLFNLFKKTPPPPTGPYRDEHTNVIYQLLFCDDAALYGSNMPEPRPYPFDVLLSDKSSIADLQKVADDSATEARAKILAYNLQMARGHKPASKELLGVIVEVGLEGGQTKSRI